MTDSWNQCAPNERNSAHTGYVGALPPQGEQSDGLALQMGSCGRLRSQISYFGYIIYNV